MSFEWMRGLRGRVAAPVREELRPGVHRDRLKFPAAFALLHTRSTARRTPLGHPLHDGDGNSTQQQHVYEAASSEQDAS